MEDMQEVAPNASYIVTGFFTPNYRPAAERLVACLRQFKIPHHIYAVTANDWHNAILMKPKIVAQAKVHYPGKDVVLLDVDCMVRASIDTFVRNLHRCDVATAICIKKRRVGRWESQQDRVFAAARVSIWRCTDGSTRLLSKWTELCQSNVRHEFGDEGFLTRAMAATPKLIIETLPREYDGHEITDIGPEGVIVHQTTRNNVPRSIIKRTKHAIFAKLTGMPYEEWKYGIKRLTT